MSTQVPIPSDWDGETWCCHVVEWPSSRDWGAILRGLVTWPKQGRFWDGSTGLIVGAQSTGLEIFKRNILEDCGMACIDELASAIDRLTEAQYNTSCCGGSGGAGNTASAPSDFDDNGTNFPPGYDDRQDYDDGKCKLSQFVIDRMLGDLDRLGAVEVSGRTASALASVLSIALLTPIPFDDMLVGVAITALSLYSQGALALNGALDELRQRLSEMDICELYNANNVEEAVANVEAWIDGGSYTYAGTATLGKYLVGVDALNVLFETPTDIYVDGLPAADCTGCQVPVWWSCSLGQVVSHTSTEVVINASLLGDGNWGVAVGKYDPAEASLEASLVSGSLSPPSSSPDFARAIEYEPRSSGVGCGSGSGNAWDDTSSSQSTGVFTSAVVVQYRSSTEFSMRFTRG